MNLTNPGLLLSGGLISMIGLAMFLYGKKMQSVGSLAVGVVLMVFPMFVHSVVWMWVIAGACIAGLYVISREG